MNRAESMPESHSEFEEQYVDLEEEKKRGGDKMIDYRRSSTLEKLDGRNRSFVGSLVSADAIDKENVSSWAFNVLEFSSPQCEAYVYYILEQFGFIREFNLDEKKVANFIGTTLHSYRKVDYHSIHHATQVTHQTGWLLLRSGVDDVVGLGLILAALCHDIDHPGNNNSFEVASESELATLYAYDRVLERHHTATALRILKKEHCNLLAGCLLEAEDVKRVKQIIVNSILATDMNIHSDMMSDLERLLPSAFNEVDVSGTKVLDALIGLIIHTADLSTNCMTLEIAKTWGSRCLKEFKHQAEREQSLGLDVTPFMSNLETEKDRAKTQFGFCAFVVKPWFSTIAKFNIFDMSEALTNVDTVIKHYDGIRK